MLLLRVLGYVFTVRCDRTQLEVVCLLWLGLDLLNTVLVLRLLLVYHSVEYLPQYPTAVELFTAYVLKVIVIVVPAPRSMGC